MKIRNRRKTENARKVGLKTTKYKRKQTEKESNK